MNIKFTSVLTLCLCGLVQSLFSQTVSDVWVADKGNGTYTNPIIHADYSDPDVCRAGDDYYMTASSFGHAPGMPILHSKDLVNWEIVNYALPTLPPEDVFAAPQHGKGVWAPCIRFHEGVFYIYWGDPDFGVYMIRTEDPLGEWSEPVLVMAGKGFIDPTPLWDDDGRVYMAYAWAASRSGVNSVVNMVELNTEGTKVISNPVMVYDGNYNENHTVEGPKLYKRNGYYYIFAPAGSVAWGWQLVMRSDNIYGPYEARIVMAEGSSGINGPHQGGWVETATGESWFVNFQDKGAYGRIIHLNSMTWNGDWPVIGVDKNNSGCGEPVKSYKKPNVGGTYPKSTPADSDEFSSPHMGLQWQWQANYQHVFGYPSPLGYFRLNAYNLPADAPNLWNVPNILLQKFMAEEFVVRTKVRFTPKDEGDRAGLIVFGLAYGAVQAVYRNGEVVIEYVTCDDAMGGAGERTVEIGRMPIQKEEYTQGVTRLWQDMYFMGEVKAGGKCRFGYSRDGRKYTFAKESFVAQPGRWVGAKVGMYAVTPAPREKSWIDIDWFRVTKK